VETSVLGQVLPSLCISKEASHWERGWLCVGTGPGGEEMLGGPLLTASPNASWLSALHGPSVGGPWGVFL
jgi:hypothetical protein